MNPANESPKGSGSAARDEAVLEAKHKVFLSHSGAQKNFVEQLCLDLERCDRYPFFEKRRDSLGIGQHFPKAIFQAIRQCQVGVLFLSDEFFKRTKWPMLELAALVESKKQNSELVIMPVFLGISREKCRDGENHKRWRESQGMGINVAHMKANRPSNRRGEMEASSFDLWPNKWFDL